jgi:hypothetical protein
MIKGMQKLKGLALVGLLAQANDTGVINLQPTGGLAGSLTGLTIGGIVAALLKLALIIAAIVFFFILVIGGIRWIVSGGDKAQTEAARGQITAALVGLVIVFAAWAIAQLIGTFFNIPNIFSLEVPIIGQ